jgi:NADPH:quinone reductase-like Zn-dependent oxidoreductase
VRALTIDAHGGPEQVHVRVDVDTPHIVEPRDVKVRVRAAALNHVDLWTLRGLPGVTITSGWILGADAAGIVEEVGHDVSSVHLGDTVFLNPGISCGRCEYCLDGEQPLCVQFKILGEHRPGTLAEYVVLPDVNVRVIPSSPSFELAAAYPLATLTAWRMCVSRARIRPEETVLIGGIGGGVALAALLVCKALGARVWVTSRSEEKLTRARALGADETIRQGEGIDVAREVRSRTGKRGVDVVIDDVGAATWKASLGSLGRRGRLVCCGSTSGPMVETDLRRLFWNQWTIMGSTMGNQSEFDAITREFTAGRLSAVVDSVFSLDSGRQALERLASGQQFGKVVVRID